MDLVSEKYQRSEGVLYQGGGPGGGGGFRNKGGGEGIRI